MGFTQSTSDPCIYASTTKSGGLFILAVYVDNILLAGKSQQKIAQIKADLRKRFQLKDMGELHYFFGVSVLQCSEEIWIGQTTYTQAVIKKFRMENCKPANTSMAPGTKLLKATEQSEIDDPTLYQSAVDSLLYLSGWTRPNIAFAMCQVAKFCSSPTNEHWTAVKHILRYLKGTPKYGLSYSRNYDINGALIGYSDVDWGGDVNDRKSTSGYLFMINGAAISWKSRKQTCVALSTAEFEYVAQVGATQEVTWIRHLLEDLHNGKTEPTIFREVTNQQSASPITPNTTARPNTLILSMIMFDKRL